MRIVFAGTPDFAAAHLQALINTCASANNEIIAVYTQPDRPSGRGNKVAKSATKQLAEQHNIIVYQPESLKTELAQEEFQQLNADILVVVAYGLILPKAILDAPKYGCINVHGSILPKWRGAAPIQRAIWAGDEKTGITIMQMDEGLDTGDILSIHTIPISPQDTSASLYDKLAQLGPTALVETIARISEITPQKQNDELATYAAKLSKQEAYLDWSLSATQLEQNVRSFNPWPVAWFTVNESPTKVWQAKVIELTESEQLKVQAGEVMAYNKNGLQIACAEGALLIQKLQLAGKKPQELNQLVNGQPNLFVPGQIII